MKISLKEITVHLLMGCLLLPMGSVRADEPKDAILAAGPFQPTDESLKQYECPEWFRDAKFGIWAVWGPQSVPKRGDWYAHYLYEHDGVDKAGKPTGQHAVNKFHLEHYGHPSKFGFKDIIPLWKAENWNPEKLMALYKQAGAKYFCMIAMHHDNFDCWDSTFTRWNSVNMGPKRDIAGEWQAAAKKEGLRFGMTEHLAASWWFYSAAHSADKTGPMAGVPYDGNDPQYADLYWSGNEKPDFHYYGENVPHWYKQNWLNRITDMVNRYHPDLLYSDSKLPYADEVGRKLVAHYYNDNLQQNGGKLEAVYNCKQESEGRWVQDLERGVMEGINPNPWQTDTCVAGWYYHTKLFENNSYKTTQSIVQMLADIVSKNGNLLLNFPPRPDGTLDDGELKILGELAVWMPINGEAIFGTRPWKIYGEGPSTTRPVEKGHFGGAKDISSVPFISEDIRFTQSKDGKSLYAHVMAWPSEGRVVIKSLAAAAGKVLQVALLGHDGPIKWSQTAHGVEIVLPDKKPCDYVFALKLTVDNAAELKPTSPNPVTGL